MTVTMRNEDKEDEDGAAAVACSQQPGCAPQNDEVDVIIPFIISHACRWWIQARHYPIDSGRLPTS